MDLTILTRDLTDEEHAILASGETCCFDTVYLPFFRADKFVAFR